MLPVDVRICTEFNNVHRSRWYSGIFDRMHLFSLFLCLFTKVHLLIDDSVVVQYVTIVLNPLPKPLGIVPRASITIGTAVTLIFHSLSVVVLFCFLFICLFLFLWQAPSNFLSFLFFFFFFFEIQSVFRWNDKILLTTISFLFFFFSDNTRSGLLAGIR